MNIERIEDKQGFSVVGISMRITNQAAVEHATIQGLWSQFFIDLILSKIPQGIDNDIIALYYDLESDKDGFYTLL